MEKSLCSGNIDDDDKVNNVLDACSTASAPTPSVAASHSDAGPSDSKAATYESALKGGNVSTAGSLGKESARAHAHGTPSGEAYHDLVGHSATRNFWLQWAEARHKDVTLTGTQITSFSRVDQTRGVYRPFAKVVAEEGGSAAARKAAPQLCSRATRLGGDWVRWNALTSRYDYLY